MPPRAPKTPDEQSFGPGEKACLQTDNIGYMCTRARDHKGDHVAHDLRGNVIKKFKGGRPYWDDNTKVGAK